MPSHIESIGQLFVSKLYWGIVSKVDGFLEDKSAKAIDPDRLNLLPFRESKTWPDPFEHFSDKPHAISLFRDRGSIFVEAYSPYGEGFQLNMLGSSTNVLKKVSKGKWSIMEDSRLNTRGRKIAYASFVIGTLVDQVGKSR